MSERVALVTGAAGAIGGAIVRRLADDGFTVAGVDVAVGADYRCDVRSEDEVLRLRGDVEGRHGTPWLLVNVAGAFFEHRITDLSVDDWDLLLDTNLKGTFLTCKTFLPAMIAAGSGCIVNIGSTAGIKGGHQPFVAIVHGGPKHVRLNKRRTAYSLLRTIEAGFGFRPLGRAAHVRPLAKFF